MREIAFVKMQGIGNDFVMVDALQHPLGDTDLPTLARAMNDRKFGIGGDGLILLERGDKAAFRMRMFNPDGSESEMCGNGIRCFAKLAHDHGHSDSETIEVETGAGLLKLTLEPDGQVRVDMGLARFKRGEIGMSGSADDQFVDVPLLASVPGLIGTAVSMGNPHLVIFVPDAKAIELERVGPELERYTEFPNRVNAHFVQVLDRSTLLQRTWERGAGATLACGTGACASAAAAWLTGRAESTSRVHLPGGVLQIEIQPDHRVFMTGPAEVVFEGVYEPSTH